jgi:hypothetical protein
MREDGVEVASRLRSHTTHTPGGFSLKTAHRNGAVHRAIPSQHPFAGRPWTGRQSMHSPTRSSRASCNLSSMLCFPPLVQSHVSLWQSPGIYLSCLFWNSAILSAVTAKNNNNVHKPISTKTLHSMCISLESYLQYSAGVFDLTLGLCVKDFWYNASNLWKKIRMIDHDACHQPFHRHKVGHPPMIYNAIASGPQTCRWN